MKKLKFTLLMAVFAFTMQNAFAQPALLEPADAALCQPNQLTFSWNPVAGAVRYRIQISDQANFSTLIVNYSQGIFTDYSVRMPNYGDEYFWRVYAVFNSDSTLSNARSFTTKLQGPNSTSPSNRSYCRNLSNSFTWNTGQVFDKYRIQVSPNSNFANPIVDTDTITATNFTASVPNNFTTYYWRVGGIYLDGNGNDCLSEWSDTLQFTTRLAAPSIIYPINLQSGVPIDTMAWWNTLAGANAYYLELSQDINFASSSSFDLGNINSTAISMNGQYNTMFYWRIKSSNDTCESNFSETFRFRTQYSRPTITSPNNAEECIPLTYNYQWTSVPGTTAYRIQFSEVEDFSTIAFDIDSIGSSSFSFRVNKELTGYYVRVRAEDNINYSEWSLPVRFSTANEPPRLQTPQDTSKNIDLGIEFAWTTLGAFTNFSFQLASNPSFAPEHIISQKSLNINSVKDTVSGYNTTYYWRVSSTFGACESGYSQPYSFTTTVGYPDLTFPENDAKGVELLILAQWERVFNAISYDVQVATDAAFTNIVTDRRGVDANDLQLALDPNIKYFWRVRTLNPYSYSPWSPTRTFTTRLPVAGTPTHVSVPNNSVKNDVNTRLVWRSITGATAYKLQVSKNANFTGTNVVVDEDVTDTTYTNSELEHFTEYFWRVLSISSGGTSPYSSPWKFRTIALAPSDEADLQAPANDAVDRTFNQLQFTWIPVPRAEGYHLQISTDETLQDEAKFHTNANPVWSFSPFIYTFLPNTKYFWRVKAFNEAGEGPWSGVFNFTTATNVSVLELDKNYFDTQILPNPIQNNSALLTFNSPTGGVATFSIMTLTGENINLKEVNASAGTNSIRLDNLNLTNGVYFLLIEHNGLSEYHKIIIAE